MKCLNSAEADALLLNIPFSLHVGELGNAIVSPTDELDEKSLRFACQPPSNIVDLRNVLVSINN